MRREDYRVEVEGVDWVGSDEAPARPTLAIDCESDESAVGSRLSSPDGSATGAEQVDVSFRLVASGGGDAMGVLAVADRLTGEFVLEANAAPEEIRSFVRAARRYAEESDADDGQYTVEIRADASTADTSGADTDASTADTDASTTAHGTAANESEPFAVFEKRTFLVYNEDGDLLRERSLIPGGVEL